MEFFRNLMSRSHSQDNGDTTIDGSNSKKNMRKTVSFEEKGKQKSIEFGDTEEEIVQIRFTGSRKPRSLTATEEFKPSSSPSRPGMSKTKSVFIPSTPIKERPAMMNRKAVSVYGARMFKDDDAEDKPVNSKFVIPMFKPKTPNPGPGSPPAPNSTSSTPMQTTLETIKEESEKRVSPIPEGEPRSPVPKMVLAEIPAFKPKKAPSVEDAKEDEIVRNDDVFKGIGLSP